MKWIILLILIGLILLNTKEGFENSMNLFSDNMSPYCEEVTYSSDSGFICLTDQQKNLLYTRGRSHSMLDADVFNFNFNF